MLKSLCLFLALTPLRAAAQQLAITFDDLPAHGPRPAAVSRLQIAQSILDTLKQQHMPPVYGFVNGVRTEEAPITLAVLQAWRDAGQPLGNHTWSHPDLEGMTSAAFEEDVHKNEPLLAKYMDGHDWRWLRYPFLHEGETTEKHREVRAWLKAHNYKPAEVTMDFGDYLWNAPYARCLAKNDTAAIHSLHDSYLAAADNAIGDYRSLAKKLYGRDISYVLLMHEGNFDAHMLPDLLALYRSRGFSFVSLPEASRDPIYAEDPDLGIVDGGTLTGQVAKKRKVKFVITPRPEQLLDETCR